MKSAHQKYEHFVNWVQNDMKKDRFHVNRKVFSVVFWCLILPSILLLVVYVLRKYQFIGSVRYADLLIYLPPFAFTIYSLWPTLRDTPKVFKKGGMNAMLEESLKEVEWRENTVIRLTGDLNLTAKEWRMISFHLRSEVQRMRQQNWYMSILAAVVLFFMFQFLDVGSSVDVVVEPTNSNLVKFWVDQFAQWSIQVFSLGLFSTLFYLSGLQFQRHFDRYLVCIERILIEEKN
jgi:uncharacterized membrane protein